MKLLLKLFLARFGFEIRRINRPRPTLTDEPDNEPAALIYLSHWLEDYGLNDSKSELGVTADELRKIAVELRLLKEGQHERETASGTPSQRA